MRLEDDGTICRHPKKERVVRARGDDVEIVQTMRNLEDGNKQKRQAICLKEDLHIIFSIGFTIGTRLGEELWEDESDQTEDERKN